MTRASFAPGATPLKIATAPVKHIQPPHLGELPKLLEFPDFIGIKGEPYRAGLGVGSFYRPSISAPGRVKFASSKFVPPKEIQPFSEILKVNISFGTLRKTGLPWGRGESYGNYGYDSVARRTDLFSRRPSLQIARPQ